MKNDNKVLMTLLTASISALAAAPYIMEKSEKVIDLSKDKNELKDEADVAKKQEIEGQIDAMLAKKSPSLKIGENINIVVDNYGSENKNLKTQVFGEMNLSANDQDSTVTKSDGNFSRFDSVINTKKSAIICHTACHGACHGARGWR